MNTKPTLKYAEEPSLDDLFVVRKFNEWMLQSKNEPVPKMLFGNLWLEGEIAVLSADPGAGKSLLAVQIAEAIAGRKKFAPFVMTAKPQGVLYLNLKLSSRQFKMRYAAEHDADDDMLTKPYKFAANLHRVDIDIHCKLPEGYRTFDEVLPTLVERLVAKTKAKVVIIDNITYLQRSVYGYRETYTMMKELHRLKTKLGISILVLARTSKYGSVRESAAGSCSALFSRFADSVFMIGKSRLDPSARYIKQQIVHSSEMIYDASHVASFVIKRLNGNFLGFEHYGFHTESEHKKPVSDESLWPTIDKVNSLSNGGEKSVRDIAAELGLSKSSVQRYLQMWTPEIGAAMKRSTPQPYDETKSPYYFPGREEYDEAKRDPKFKLLMDTSIPDDDPRYMLLMREYSIIDNASYRASQVYKKTGITPKLAEDKQYAEFMKIIAEGGDPLFDGVSNSPDDLGPIADENKIQVPAGSSLVNEKGWPTVNEKGVPIDLRSLPEGVKHEINDHGRDVWIEKRDERGKPVIWYSFDSKGKKQKHERDSNGVKITRDKDPDKLE